MNRLKQMLALMLGLLLAVPANAQDGEALFQANCTSCHQIDNRLVGPALKGVTSRWDKKEELVAFVQNSQKVIKSGHPYANELYEEYGQMVMPPFGLEEAEVLAIMDYIDAQGAEEPAAAAAAAGAGGAGDGAAATGGAASAELSESQRMTLKIIGIAVALLLSYVFYVLVQVQALVTRARFDQQAQDPEVEYEVTENNPYTSILNIFRKPDALQDAKMEGHSYDGIVEYDNNPPAWFNWLFFGSIGWAVVYLLVYHIFNLAPLQHEEYAQQMEKAQVQQAKLAEKTLKNMEDMEVITDEVKLREGANIYNNNCAQCHGKNLEGGVGPNLADEAWIHGCSIQDVFMTIYDGVPSKGMLSWKKQLRPDEIQAVSSYIISKRGSEPANGKSPQGEPCSNGQTVDASH